MRGSFGYSQCFFQYLSSFLPVLFSQFYFVIGCLCFFAQELFYRFISLISQIRLREQLIEKFFSFLFN